MHATSAVKTDYGIHAHRYSVCAQPYVLQLATHTHRSESSLRTADSIGDRRKAIYGVRNQPHLACIIVRPRNTTTVGFDLDTHCRKLTPNTH